MRRTATTCAALILGLAMAGCGSSTTTEGEPVPSTSSAAVTPSTETAAPDTTMTDDDAMSDHSMVDDEMSSDTTSEHAGMSESEHEDMEEASAAWPRPWDPAQPIDFSGVPGVTPQQQQFAQDLAAKTIADLPAFADTASLGELGYFSIGDEETGYEHYINASYLLDDRILDPNYPESVVYEVDGPDRKLVSAMFMVADKQVDDPELEAIGGPLMQWHIHNDLCWELTPEGPQVVGVHQPGTPCPDGQIAGGEDIPMVHVWIVPHQCGPFAALEGIGAGQVDPDAEFRMDQCHEEH